MAHAIQIRKRAVELLEEGHTQEVVAKLLNVGTTSKKRWKNQISEYGDIHFFYNASTRIPPKLTKEELEEHYKNNPDALLKETAGEFDCDPSAIFYACKRYKITLKKKTVFYKERNEEAREKFLSEVSKLDPNTIAYIDESGIDEHYHRERGRAPKGEKVYGEVSGKKFQRTNLVAGFLDGKAVAPLQYSGSTDSSLFEYWFEHQLIPAIPAGTTVVLDRAAFHRIPILTELLEPKGCFLLPLPAYSPDYNQIEYALWANLKNFLRRYMKRFQSLTEALADFFRFK